MRRLPNSVRSGQALLAFAVALALPVRAGAWEPEVTESGAWIHWEVGEVRYVLNEVGSEELGEGAFGPVRDSFATWNAEPCQPFQFVDGGLTTATTSDYVEGEAAGREVLVVWREEAADWDYSTTAVAMTTLVYVIESGRLVDSDVEFNGAQYTFGDLVSAPGSGGDWDIGNTMTHEIGHIVGLEHSHVAGATMAESAMEGEVEKRTLSADDREGLCAIYAPGSSAGGCQTVHGAAATGLWLPLTLGFLLLMLWRRRTTGATLVVVLSLLTPTGAQAWSFYETESGETLRWLNPAQSYAIDDSGITGLSLAETIEVVERSFATWNAVDCSSVQLSSQGAQSGLVDEVFSARYETNAVVFVKSDWPDSSTAVGLTWMTHNLRTGAMRDADIMLNEEFMSFGLSPTAGSGLHDVQNTVTHEIGHYLGMAHSAVDEATMAASAPAGEVAKRDLHEDDIEGLCFVYPASTDPSPDTDGGDISTAPADAGGEGSGGDGGCNLSAAPSSPLAWGLILGLCAALASLRRRSRRVFGSRACRAGERRESLLGG